MNGRIILFERQVISILSAVLFAVILAQAYGAPARAANNYSNAEKIYLKNVTPILYEYSQVASQVSANVLPLQSAPPEECSSEFSGYFSIMSALGKQLGTITPPARFESVQADSASAISDYERALNLYGAACTQEDFGTKEELVSRAGADVNRSVARINKVYKDIEDLGAVAAAPAAPAPGSTAPENLSETAIGTAPLEESTQIEEQYVEEEVPAAPAATPAPRTREEVLEELSGTANTGAAPEAVEVEKPAPPAPVVEAPKPTPPPAVKAPEPTKPAPEAPAPPAAETAKIETPAATAPPAPAAEPEPVATEPPPAPPKPAATPAPAATEEAPAAGHSVSPAEQAAVQEALQSAEEVGPPPPGPGDVTEKSMDTAALAPEELKEEALPEDEINTWCNSRYQMNFEREECVKKRTEARDRAETLVTSFEDGTPERNIVEKCRSDWKEGDTYNYEMVVSCTQFFCNQKGLEACTKLAK
ncbi:MAG: hypothetical protein AB7I96_10885 [Candidatus Dadabacteria bacterium]